MSKILLTTLNARYHHASFGLRYLYANLQELQSECKIQEFTINQNVRDIANEILIQQPRILGIGVYIWNTDASLALVNIIKKVSPNTIIVLGGPEVSYESETQSICQQADFVFKGESDFAFYEFCKQVLIEKKLPSEKFIKPNLPEIKNIALPYKYYSDEDIKNRVIYVEASRGCPYKCEYCLSSLDASVRNFDIDLFLSEMDTLIERGLRQFKFVDRTFNLSPSISTKILQFFLDRIDKDLFLHFELVPDRLPNELKALIEKFPKGSLQFEIGIQTFNPEVSKLVSRRQDYKKIDENFKYLRAHTGVHTHADLIAGLPGETMESFARGFDTLLELSPDEIQVGILKRLKGTPIIRHDASMQMQYQDFSPFQILQTKDLSYFEIQQIQAYADFWDQIANSGNYKNTMQFLKQHFKEQNKSFFHCFMEMSLYFQKRHGQRHSIAMVNLLESIYIYAKDQLGIDQAKLKELLISDYTGRVKRDIPKFLRDEDESYIKNAKSIEAKKLYHAKTGSLTKRQDRHLQ